MEAQGSLTNRFVADFFGDRTMKQAGTMVAGGEVYYYFPTDG